MLRAHGAGGGGVPVLQQRRVRGTVVRYEVSGNCLALVIGEF
jgi:hypothetical protein